MTPSDTQRLMTGEQRIAAAFAEARANGRPALMPYFTLGYPDRVTSIDIIASMARYGDLMELGVPFSDPIADGPTIQRSTQVSLEGGTTVAGCLEMVSEIRRRGVQTPAMLMGYYNPIIAFGEVRFVEQAAAAGVDGLIVPDLPPEESESLERATRAAGMAYVHFLAPTSNPERIGAVIARASGFIYMVSVTGVTGARAQVSGDLEDFVRAIRRQSEVPVAVGFGISTGEQAAMVGGFADGVIVGSALVGAVDASADKVRGAEEFVRGLRKAMDKAD